MKSYNNLYTEMLKPENIRQCFLDAAKGKRNRRDVVKVMNNLDTEVKIVHEMLEAEGFKPRKHKVNTINRDNNVHKTREITKPTYQYEQVVHHCVIKQLQPIIQRSMYDFSCGSVPGRGIHYGKKFVRKWIDSYNGKKLYIFKFDIHHFFQSVDHDILKAKLAKKIKDKRFLNLLFTIIDGVKEGLPLGFYTSQWFANFYLQDFDYFVKQTLGAEHYMRYMDDCVIFGKNKKQLHKMRTDIVSYLEKELHLELKGDWQVFRLAYVDKKTGKEKGRPIDFMGMKFYTNRTTIRKRILRSAMRKARKIEKKDRVTWYDATQMISFVGWFTHTDSYGYFARHIKPRVNVQKLRKKVSDHQRRENKKNARMGNRRIWEPDPAAAGA